MTSTNEIETTNLAEALNAIPAEAQVEIYTDGACLSNRQFRFLADQTDLSIKLLSDSELVVNTMPIKRSMN